MAEGAVSGFLFSQRFFQGNDQVSSEGKTLSSSADEKRWKRIP
jgi:hypothetical protein